MWLCDWLCDLLPDEDWSLNCRCCLHFRIFSNPHVSNMVLMLMMIKWEIKITVYLTALPPCPGHPHWPGSYHWTPSPQSFHLPICVAAGSPLSWSHHLSPHWGQGDIHELTFWSSLTQRRRSIVWTWSLWKMELLLLYSRLFTIYVLFLLFFFFSDKSVLRIKN